MTLNADQLHAAERRWHIETHHWHDAALRAAGFPEAAGPYRVLVLGAATRTEPHPVASTRVAFPGVGITYLRARTGDEVVPRRLSLHVVPQAIYAVVGHQAHHGDGIESTLEPPPFADPPTESDLAAVFIRAMSTTSAPPGSIGLGLATRQACDRLGWRTVAAVVGAMDEDTLWCPEHVGAILTALAAEPASAG